MIFNIVISLLLGFLIGYEFGFKFGKEKGRKKFKAQLPLYLLQKSLEEGHCLICNQKKDNDRQEF
ncbi:MAG: hypothetical protein ACOCP5_01200 [Halanaerobiaceae bacterium]